MNKYLEMPYVSPEVESLRRIMQVAVWYYENKPNCADAVNIITHDYAFLLSRLERK